MGSFFRGLFLLACAIGGVIGALKLVEVGLARYGSLSDLQFQQGGPFITIPAGIVGALVGATIGGILLPRRR